MGTISEKLTYLNDTKGLLKDKINNLGGSIDDNTTFRQYANQLQNVYDNLPKTEYQEGSNITLSNTLKGKLDFEDGIVGIGDTKQEGTPTPDNPQDIEVVRGKNRLQLENGTNTTYNVTAITENGKITLNGTPNSNTYSRLISTFTANTTDIFTLSPNKSATNSDIRLLYTINDGSLVNSDNTPQISLNIGDVVKVYLRISSTSQITNFTLQPQLEKGSQATSYLPFNTIEVKARGKNNLLCRTDIPMGYIRTDNGITWQRTGENTFKLNGTASGNFTLIVGTATPLMENLKTGETYTLSGCPSGGSDSTYRLQLFNFNGTNTAYDTGSGATFVSNVVSTSNVAIRVFDGTTINNLEFNVQIELGSTKTSFIPFEVTTKQLSLGDKELAKISTYVDTFEYNIDNDKVYLNKRIIKKIITSSYLNGLYAFGLQSINSYGIANFILQVGMEYIYPSDINGLCNYLSPQASLIANEQNEGILYQPRNEYIRISQDRAKTKEEFKAYVDNLNANGNPLVIYRALNEVVKEEITGTLKDQIKALYNSQSFTGTTIIEIDGQLPLIIKVRGLKGE